jgi:hypothetical protein
MVMQCIKGWVNKVRVHTSRSSRRVVRAAGTCRPARLHCVNRTHIHTHARTLFTSL